MSGLSGRNYEPKHNLARSARSLMSQSSEYSYEPSHRERAMSGLSGRNYEPKHNLARSARSLMSQSSEYSYEPSGPGPWLGSFEISRSPLGPLGSMPTLGWSYNRVDLLKEGVDCVDVECKVDCLRWGA